MEYKALILSSLGATFSFLIGGWSLSLQVLIVLVIIDFITGVVCAFLSKELRSRTMWIGLIKKSSIFFAIVLANMVDVILGSPFPFVKTTAIYFYFSQEGLSILENLGKMGVPLPEALKDSLEALKNKSPSGISSKKKNK